MTNATLRLSLALVIFLGAWKPCVGQDINFCSLPVSQAILQAHLSSNDIYEFDVDKDGTPQKIRSISKQLTKSEDVAACMMQWKFPSATLKHLVAVFEWQHGIGWTKLAVSGPGVLLTIRLSGQQCPYSSKSVGVSNAPESPPK